MRVCLSQGTSPLAFPWRNTYHSHLAVQRAWLLAVARILIKGGKVSQLKSSVKLCKYRKKCVLKSMPRRIGTKTERINDPGTLQFY